MMIKNEAASYLVNARLFNSDYNANKILAEFQRDEGVKFSAQEVREIVFVAEKIWNGYREEACVTAPVSDEERKEITLMMEKSG